MLVDFSIDLRLVKLEVDDAVAVFGELIWDSEMMSLAEASVEGLKNVYYMVAKESVDELILKYLYRENQDFY